MSGATTVAPDEGRPTERVDDLAAAVLAVPGVLDLHGGLLGEVATYLPGRRVAGIRLRDAEDGEDATTEVHLVVAVDAPLHDTVEAVRAAVRPLVGPGPVHVTVEDVVRRPEPEPQD